MVPRRCRPLALPFHIVAEEIKLTRTTRDQIAGDTIDEQMAKPIGGKRGIEPRLEEEKAAVFHEAIVKGAAFAADAQKIERQSIAVLLGEGVRQGTIAASQSGIASDRSTASA